jgi:hypothetical protein
LQTEQTAEESKRQKEREAEEAEWGQSRKQEDRRMIQREQI